MVPVLVWWQFPLKQFQRSSDDSCLWNSSSMGLMTVAFETVPVWVWWLLPLKWFQCGSDDSCHWNSSSASLISLIDRCLWNGSSVGLMTIALETVPVWVWLTAAFEMVPVLVWWQFPLKQFQYWSNDNCLWNSSNVGLIDSCLCNSSSVGQIDHVPFLSFEGGAADLFWASKCIRLSLIV